MSRPMPDHNVVRPGHPMRISSPDQEQPPIRYGETVTNVDLDGRAQPVYIDAEGRPTNRPRPGGYTLPPGLAHQAAQEAAQVEVSTAVDHIAEDAEAPKAEFPPGSPEMVPFYLLSFKRRAEALRMFAELETMQSIDVKPGDKPTIEQAAVMFERLAKLDEFLATVAKDKQVYLDWVDGPGGDTEVFGQFWNAYQARFQPGEADSSSS